MRHSWKELQWQLEDLQQQKLELEQQQRQQPSRLATVEQTRRMPSSRHKACNSNCLRLEAQQAAAAAAAATHQPWPAYAGMAGTTRAGSTRATVAATAGAEARWETAVEAVLRDMLQALPEPADLASLLADAVPARLGLVLYSQQACESSFRAPRERCKSACSPGYKLSSESAAIMAALASLLQQVYVCDGSAAFTDIAPAFATRHAPGFARGPSCQPQHAAIVCARQRAAWRLARQQRERWRQLAQDIALLQTQLDSARLTLQEAEQALRSIRRMSPKQGNSWIHQPRAASATTAVAETAAGGRTMADAAVANRRGAGRADATIAAGAGSARRSKYADRPRLDQQIDPCSRQRQQAQRAVQSAAKPRWNRRGRRVRNLDPRCPRGQIPVAHRAEPAARQQLAISHAERQQQLQQQQEELLLELENLAAGRQDDALQAALLRRSEREQQLHQARDALDHLTNLLRESPENAAGAGAGPAARQHWPVAPEKRRRHGWPASVMRRNSMTTAPIFPLCCLCSQRQTSSLQAQIGNLTQQIRALGAVNLAAMQGAERIERAEAFPRFAGGRPESGDGDAGKRHPQNRQGVERAAAKHLDQVNASMSRAVSLVVWRWSGAAGDDQRNHSRCRHSGDRATAGQEKQFDPFVSGGEKALTALSLVFALFQLNPAPFACWTKSTHRWTTPTPGVSARWSSACRRTRSSSISATTRSPWRWPTS